MSASIDKGIDKGKDGPDEDSREVLSAWLDDYIAGRCDRAKMHESFLEVCRSNPEAPWDALALLDQYQRRGRVEVGLARSLKAEIAQLVFGVANQTDDARDSEATLDTTGSRWRKLYEERGSVNADEAPVEDPALRRDFDPVTRPPPRQTRAAQAREVGAGGAPEVAVGTILRDRYELMEVMGSGRAGTVYQAFDRHRSHLPSPSCYVAVRVLRLPRDGREAALADIEREAYEAQSLSHPNIVSVFDLDRHQDVYFVVMELLDGEPLSRVMQKLGGRPMSRDRAFAVISAAGAALSHAHQRNIAHGDLKPDAIVLTTNGEVKVLDFGFARTHSLDQWGGGEPTLDGAGANTTAAYASVERVAGEEPSARDDVYSLACIAYELLSGRHPYGGRSAPLARAHGRPPQKISALSPRQWHSLQKALDWDREGRRIDVGELLASFGCADAAQQIPALPASRPSMDNPFGRGKGVLLAFLLVAAAGGVAWWQLPRFIEPARVSPVAGPAEVDAERPMPSATSSPAGETIVATPPVAPQKALPEEPVQESAREPSKKSPIVAATADPPPSAANATKTANGAPKPAEEAPSEPRASAEAARDEAPRSSSRTSSVEFDKDTYVATESDAMVRLTVRRNGSTRSAARFRWALRSNSAEAGSDYAGIGPGVEEVPAGSRTVTLTIPLVSDVVVENTELFLVELEALDGGPEIGEQAHAAVILVDDD